MKLIVFCVMLLVFLGETYCTSTMTVNKTSTSWGYDYSISDTREFKVKHDDKGYQFEPLYNNTSSGLKQHYNSRSFYDKFTSPGTNSSQSESYTYDRVTGTLNGNTDTRTKGTVPQKVLLDTSADGAETTKLTETQTGVPTVPSPSQGTVFRDLNRSQSIPANGPPYKTTSGALYDSQNTPTYGSLYYSQIPTYGEQASGPVYGLPNGQMYGPATGPMYGQPTGPTYGQSTGPFYGQPTGPIYGYAPQDGQLYGPQNGQMYRPQNGQMYGSQSGQMYGSQSGQMYGPQNGQTYGYPTRSL